MIPELHELVVEFGRQMREKVGRADEKDWSDLTSAATHGEDTTSEHSGEGVREHDAENVWLLVAPRA